MASLGKPQKRYGVKDTESSLPQPYIIARVNPGDIAFVSTSMSRLGKTLILDPNPKWPRGIHQRILESYGWYPVGVEEVWSGLIYEVVS